MIDVLGNKGRITRLLLLFQMVKNPPKDQRTLSEPVGITPQAVSDYLAKMKDEGLVYSGPEGPRATIGGVEQLHRDLLSLKDFVDTSIGKLDIIRSTDAMALDPVEKGDRVYLVLRDGLLCAVREGDGSSGMAERNALPGEMVPISSLSGLLDLKGGKLVLAEIPPARAGGGRGKITGEGLMDASGIGISPYRIAALDLESIALFRRSDLEYDMEMPPPEGVIEPLSRGLDVIAVGTPFSISRVLRAFERSPSDHNIERLTLTPE